MLRCSLSRVTTLVLVVLLVPSLLILHTTRYLVLRSVGVNLYTNTPLTTKRDPHAELEQHLKDYQQACEAQTPVSRPKNSTLPHCPCLPIKPVGLFKVGTWYNQQYNHPSSLSPSYATKNEPDVPAQTLPPAETPNTGGWWKPMACIARQTVAVIIPFRNRHEHLRVFLAYMHPFLQRQLAEYRIFVIEQNSPDIFNRAALMNIGFIEANRVNPKGFDCYIFHDVDLLPEDDRNMYTCFKSPLHLGAYMNKFTYRMPYPEFFGGAIALSKQHMIDINGFANKYYGWGGEDDDTYNRVLYRNLSITRYPQVVGQSFMFKHEADVDNPKNPLRNQGYEQPAEEYKREGLTSVQYEQLKVMHADQFTKVTVSIEKKRDPSCVIKRHLPATLGGNYVDCLTKVNFNQGTVECCRSWVFSHHVYCCDSSTFYRYSLWLLGTCVGVAMVMLSWKLLCQYRRQQHAIL